MKKIVIHKKWFHGLSKFRGFSVLEIIFGVSIFVLVFGAIGLLSRNIWIYNSFVSAGLDDADAGRKVIKTILAEIRKASTADTGAYIISSAGTSSFTFHSDIDEDGLKERVRYFYENSSLKKGVIKPTGSPLSYNSLNETLQTVVTNVISSSIFEYYDDSYDGTTAPLSSPVDVSQIRLVKVSITKDKDPNRPPVATTFSTQVSIRNLKDNL